MAIEGDLKQRESASSITNKVVTRVNGIPTKETITTFSVDDELIYTDGQWKEQEVKTVTTNNI